MQNQLAADKIKAEEEEAAAQAARKAAEDELALKISRSVSGWVTTTAR